MKRTMKDERMIKRNNKRCKVDGKTIKDKVESEIKR
jgi:hypothetical protein